MNTKLNFNQLFSTS